MLKLYQKLLMEYVFVIEEFPDYKVFFP